MKTDNLTERLRKVREDLGCQEIQVVLNVSEKETVILTIHNLEAYDEIRQGEKKATPSYLG